MPNVTVTREVKAPLAGVWASWDDFANIYKFNPNLSHSSLLEDGKEKAGLGARRVCEFKDGKNWIHEEIVDYTPQSKIKIHVYEGTLPLKESFATISFKSLGEGKTLVTFSMDFTPRFGVLGLLLAPLMKPHFKKLLSQLLEGNEKYVARGELANPEPPLNP